MGNADVLQIRRRRLEESDWIYIKIDAAQADVPEESLTMKGGVRIRPPAMILQRQGNPYPIKPPSFHRVDHEVALVYHNRDQAEGLARAARKVFGDLLVRSLTPKGARVNCLTDAIMAPVVLNQK